MCIGRADKMSSINEEASGDARGKALIQVLSFVLDKMVLANEDRPENNVRITKFHALRPPTIGISDYLTRIFQYASCSPECFVLSLIYIDRLIQRNGFLLTPLTVHRVIITSVVLAAKFFDDHYFNNAYYARIGGIPVEEMNALELEFLFLTNFSLHVSPESYARYYNELANHYVFSNALQSFTNQQDERLHHYITERDNQLVYITHTKPAPPSSKCTGQKRTSSVALGVAS